MACSLVDKERTDKTMDISTMDINAIFSEMAQYKAIIKQAEAELAKYEAEVKDRMTTSGIDEILGNEHHATYREVVQNRFDSKAFKADGYEDLYKAYQKPSSSMRFTFA